MIGFDCQPPILPHSQSSGTLTNIFWLTQLSFSPFSFPSEVMKTFIFWNLFLRKKFAGKNNKICFIRLCKSYQIECNRPSILFFCEWKILSRVHHKHFSFIWNFLKPFLKTLGKIHEWLGLGRTILVLNNHHETSFILWN